MNEFLKALIKDKTILDYTYMDIYLIACQHNHLDIMKYLENEHNWDIHVKDNVGRDAYLIASEYNYLEIMKYLENEHNWDIHAKDIKDIKDIFNNDAYYLEMMKCLKNEHNWHIHVKYIHPDKLKISNVMNELLENNEYIYQNSYLD